MLLGKTVPSPERYTRELLDALKRPETLGPIPRTAAVGEDFWVGYEVSWLDQPSGLPMQGVLLLSVPAASPYIIESKSLKLYVNSFFQERFTATELLKRIGEDLSEQLMCPVQLALAVRQRGWSFWPEYDEKSLNLASRWPGAPEAPKPVRGDFGDPEAIVLDALAQRHSWSFYQELEPKASMLEQLSDEQTWQCYTFHAFRSVCPVTGQPDWASLYLRFLAPLIKPQSLLRYLLAYRYHGAFHESCIEAIFADLLNAGATEVIAWGRFLRRGGWEINPVRASHLHLLPKQWWFDERQ